MSRNFPLSKYSQQISFTGKNTFLPIIVPFQLPINFSINFHMYLQKLLLFHWISGKFL